MLFLVADIGPLPHVEGVDAVMAALVAAAVVDAAAGHNGDVRSVGDVEVIVHDIHHTGGAHHHRDMHLLALCIPVYIHIYTGLVFLFSLS